MVISDRAFSILACSFRETLGESMLKAVFDRHGFAVLVCRLQKFT